MIVDDNGLEAYIERKQIAEYLRRVIFDANIDELRDIITAVSTGTYRAKGEAWNQSAKTQ